MQTTIIAHHPNELIVRKAASLYALVGSLMFIFLVPFTKHYLNSFSYFDTKSLVAGSVIFLFMLGTTIAMWYNFFDRKPVFPPLLVFHICGFSPTAQPLLMFFTNDRSAGPDERSA
jgi:hypothetical protein